MRLLLLGGGHAHVRALSEFRDSDVTLVTPFPHHTYSGMVPGFIAGHYRLDEIRIDLASLAARAGVKLVIGRVAALDAAKRVARLEDGRELQYDIASLNLGSIPAAAPGSAEHALAAKPFENFMERWLEVKDRVRKVGVVGAGAAGVEIAMAAAYRAAADVTLYSDRPAVAPRVARALQRNGVTLRSNTPVTAVEPGPAVLAGNAREAFDLVIWTAGAAPLPWLCQSGLATDAQGFVLVDDKLRSVSHPEVFAAGDCATLRDAPHPKSGVYAVRHGEVLAQNLRGGELRSYTPQRRALALISCGARTAIAEWNGWSAEGAWAWRWKDRIDRRWIAGFRT
jgi:pyridine nucleotide-disulfide oxidoreductase family protein